jgi:hypothetical protein
MFNRIKMNSIRCIIDSMETKTLLEKFDCLSKLRDICNNFPKQRSIEWIKNRFSRIGGSEIAKLKGKSPNLYPLIKVRMFPEYSFSGNTATRLGIVFENVTILLMNKLFGIDIEEFPAIPGKLLNTAYSPDGVSIIWLDGMLKLVLWEFKSPYLGGINGSIPTKYVPQIKLGMHTLPFLDGCNFVNSIFKICSFYDFYSQNMKYNYALYSNKREFVPKQIYAIGVIMLFDNNSTYMHENFTNWKKDIVDCGGLDKNDLDKILIEITSGRLIPEYEFFDILPSIHSHPYFSNGKEEPDSTKSEEYFEKHYERLMKKTKCAAYIPWKLFEFDIIYVENKDPYYFDKNVEKCLKQFGDIMNEYKNNDHTEEKKWELLGKYFPDVVDDKHFQQFANRYDSKETLKQMKEDDELFA